MTFLAKPLRLTRDDMVKYILALDKTKLTWRPVGVTLHNAAEPDLEMWAKYTEAQKENWGANYDFFCKSTNGWHSGPHFMGTLDDWSYVLCDPLSDGVHASCFNHDHYGCETVGNFADGADDPLNGPGLAAMQSSANILAALCAWMGWEPAQAINFHRECKADGHPCPGARVTSEWAVGLVSQRLLAIKAPGAPVTTTAIPKAIVPEPVEPIVLPVWPTNPADPFFTEAREVFTAWRALGVSIPFALAMVTQAEFESAFRTNVVGDHDAAWNMHQWHAPRVLAILAGCGVDVRTETDRAKIVTAAWWELNHTEIAAREAIAAAKTAHDASIAACTLFEGAGAPMAAQRRGVGAERWSVYFAEHPTA